MKTKEYTSVYYNEDEFDLLLLTLSSLLQIDTFLKHIHSIPYTSPIVGGAYTNQTDLTWGAGQWQYGPPLSSLSVF